MVTPDEIREFMGKVEEGQEEEVFMSLLSATGADGTIFSKEDVSEYWKKASERPMTDEDHSEVILELAEFLYERGFDRIEEKVAERLSNLADADESMRLVTDHFLSD